MKFSMGKQSIEAEGMRSAGDEFFAGKEKQKSLDQIPLEDVERAAYTNCMNNGIKRIIPGLRNLDISDLACFLCCPEIRFYLNSQLSFFLKYYYLYTMTNNIFFV